jgi:hypothetical protein
MVNKILIMSWTYNPLTFHRTEHYFTSKQKAVKYYKNKVAKNEPVCLYIQNYILPGFGGIRSWSPMKDDAGEDYHSGYWKSFYAHWKNNKK